MSLQSLLVLWTYTTLTLLCLLVFVLYLYFTRHFNYWKKRNVPFLKPIPFFGNCKDIALFKTSSTEWYKKLYHLTKEPYLGIFLFDQPHLLINSPELVKHILIKDYQYFRDRTVFVPEHDVILQNLLFWTPTSGGWKTMRSKVSSFFSSGKLKGMVSKVNTVGMDLRKFLREQCTGKTVCAKHVGMNFSTDVISLAGLGVEAHSFKDENAAVKSVAKKIFEFTYLTAISQLSHFFFPIFVKIFRLSFYGKENLEFLCSLMSTAIEAREKNGGNRNDLVDILIKMKKENIPGLDGVRLTSQGAQIFIGGFETTSTTLGFALYELCLNKEIQNKLREEILEITKLHGSITYEAIKDMKYLDKVVKETLRRYPVLPFLDRECNEDYKLPGTDLIIEKGTPVYIPLLGLHSDERFFPDPEKFDPERFDDMSKINQNGLYYIPFGDGPRSCVGERFGLLASKLAIVHVLSEFEVERTESTPVPIRFEKKAFLVLSDVGLPMKFTPLNQNAN